jgi:hypothetical protein
MPSETHSPRKGTRLVASSTRLLSGRAPVLALLLLFPLACASNTQPQAFAITFPGATHARPFGF